MGGSWEGTGGKLAKRLTMRTTWTRSRWGGDVRRYRLPDDGYTFPVILLRTLSVFVHSEPLRPLRTS